MYNDMFRSSRFHFPSLFDFFFYLWYVYDIVLAQPDRSVAFASGLIKLSNAAKVPRIPHSNTHQLNKYLGWIVAKSVSRDFFCYFSDIKTLFCSLQNHKIVSPQKEERHMRRRDFTLILQIGTNLIFKWPLVDMCELVSVWNI